MSNYQFQGSLYRNRREMLDAVAEAWLGGGRVCDKDDLQALRDTSAESAASQCIEGFGLNQDGDDENLSHMLEHDYDRDDLAAAFERLRERLEAE